MKCPDCTMSPTPCPESVYPQSRTSGSIDLGVFSLFGIYSERMRELPFNRRSKWERLCRRIVRGLSEESGLKLSFRMRKVLVKAGPKDEYVAMVVVEDENRLATCRVGFSRTYAARGLSELLSGRPFREMDVVWRVRTGLPTYFSECMVPAGKSSFGKSYEEIVLELESRGIRGFG